MKERVMAQLSYATMPFVGTFHSLGVRILKQEAKLAGRTSAFSIFDDSDTMSTIKSIMKKMNIPKDDYNPMMVRNKISSVKNELLEPEELLQKKLLAIFNEYEATLQKSNAFDFDDLLEKVVRIFKTHPAVLEKYRRQFQYVLVDEFQDVNTSQYQFVKLLAEQHRNLSVVGDDAQSIYAFRGSDFRNFLNFEKDWPGAKVVKLEQNYRSTGTIIAAASAVITHNTMQKPKELWTDNDAGEPITMIAAEDGDHEADAIVRELLARVKGKTAAIIYRTNAQSRAIEQALIAANISYRIFGGLKFYERKEVKDVVAGLRVAFNSKDSASKERIEKTFTKNIARHVIEEMPRLAQELSVLQLINFFLENTRYFDQLDRKFHNAQERVENINELIHFASEFNSLGEFLERVSLLQSADQPVNNRRGVANNARVHLMSIHLAKGLEFNMVFVVGCNEGLLPHQMSYSAMDELEEERRLMYVAMTRARHKLFLSFFGIPSRFLYEIPKELTTFSTLTPHKKEELPDEDEMYIEEW